LGRPARAAVPNTIIKCVPIIPHLTCYHAIISEISNYKWQKNVGINLYVFIRYAFTVYDFQHQIQNTQREIKKTNCYVNIVILNLVLKILEIVKIYLVNTCNFISIFNTYIYKI
jgi:hypothetical protein